MNAGSRVKYFVYPNKAARGKHKGKKVRRGTVLQSFSLGQMVDVNLDGDPFGTYVSCERVELLPDERDDSNRLISERSNNNRLIRDTKRREMRLSERSSANMPTSTKPSPRELRKQAKGLGIRGWADMSSAELIEAIAEAEGDEPARPAKRAAKATKATGRTPASTKTPAAKAKAKAAKAADNGHEVAENGNPFKEGTNLWYITEELLKGGRRDKMVTRLKKKIELKPRTNVDDFDVDAEMDRRVLIIGQLLRKDHGFEVTREGRGPEATIVAVPPS